VWPDNETDIDLLGFDYLVDQLEVLLTNERLLPLTVLLSGDYGSGKSSLMEVARNRLLTDKANRDRFICVTFTPWRFEDFHFGKVALMTAVVDAIADYADDHTGVFKDTARKANQLRRTLHRWGILKHAASFGAAAAGAGPEEIAAAAAGADIIGGAGTDDDGPRRTFESVAHFHTEFEELIESLGDKVQAVVVFIDDMDRCSSTETIVETFEAMRLFLHAPKTAYVVGAHEPVVEAALDTRYEGRSAGDESFGSHWLEKMLQNTIAVPPLGEPEVMSYINLLFAELYTTKPEFEQLRVKASENRKSNPFQVAMNEGIAAATIGELSAELVEALGIAAQIGPLLAQALRGNPRETKRFLNLFLMRRNTAKKRKMNLDAAKLAKLMVLERLLDRQHFEQVFKWQLAADTGAPPELRMAEQVAHGQKPGSVPAPVREWVAQPKVASWLRLEPSLADVNLAPYFLFSRDRLATLITAPRLSTELQQLLGSLQDTVDPLRVKAVDDTLKLDDAARAELLPALLEAAQQNLDGPAAKSLREMAKVRGDVATAMFDMLASLAVSKATANFALDLGTDFRRDARARPVLEKWEAKGSAAVKRNAKRALDKLS
jgi:hypothetical protein